MKTKIVIVLLAIVSIISFTALSTTKQAVQKEKNSSKVSYESSQTLDDKGQFN